MEFRELANSEDAQNKEVRERTQIGGKGQCTRQYAVLENGQEVGLLVMDLCPDTEFAFLYEVFVLKQFRHRGIGSRILAAAEEFSQKGGYRRLCVEAVPFERDYTERDLVAWYERHGYRLHGHRPNVLAKELI